MSETHARGYRSTYELFDSPLMRQLRAESYDEDIGQHSWLTAAELRGYFPTLNLQPNQKFLDFGCGPGGPLTFLVQEAGAYGVGLDLSPMALRIAQARAARLGVSERVELYEADGNDSLIFKDRFFEVVVSFDVILHLQERRAVFLEWHRVLNRNGLVLFTDAGVVTGCLSSEEVQIRSVNGFTQYVPDGYNEKVLHQCGFTVVEKSDQTKGSIANASGRLFARQRHEQELAKLEGRERYEQQQRYLETVVNLYERSALSRFAYVATLS